MPLQWNSKPFTCLSLMSGRSDLWLSPSTHTGVCHEADSVGIADAEQAILSTVLSPTGWPCPE